ncbi:MAG: response regulator transcription factor [Verrucomicrobia bacterium]|nr:response regulator transcription factor [Verrucomicrobiota bacterium]
MRYKKSVTIDVSIVEDDPHARKILAAWVSGASSFQLAGEWSNAESALAPLAERKPHVVLMDINLPGMSGVDAVKRLKPMLPDTQFLMLTVYEDTDHIYNALAAGATGYLLKQTPRDELLAALQDVHRGGSPMTSNIARRVVQSFLRDPAPAAASEVLSTREQEVLDMLMRGYLFKEVADRLNISVHTVNTYVRRIYEKLHVRSRAQAVAKYAHFVEGGARPHSSARG